VVGVSGSCIGWIELPRGVGRAFEVATSGHPGPVLVDLPRMSPLVSFVPHPLRGYHPWTALGSPQEPDAPKDEISIDMLAIKRPRTRPTQPNVQSFTPSKAWEVSMSPRSGPSIRSARTVLHMPILAIW